jgi:hypothetical protein
MNATICLKATVLKFLARPALSTHLQACQLCQHHILQDEVIAGLIRSYTGTGVDLETSPRFLLRLRSAILGHPREIDFWEAAVLAAKGWLISFGTLAALLIALSALLMEKAPTQGEAVPYSSQTFALPDSSANILIASGEAPSPEAVLLTLVSEEKNYDHK